MKGHKHLMAMRERHKVPALVFVDTEPTGCIDESLNALYVDSVNVWIEPSDVLSRLDLRCFVGLTLSVTGSSEERVAEVAAAALKAGAKRVMTGVFADTGERFRCVHHTDTEGGYEWRTS